MGLHLVFVHVVQQGVVGNGGEVIEFVIIDIGAITFGNHLFDIVIHHCVGFAGPRRSQYDGGTERVHHIDPSVIELAAILEPGRQVDGILILHQPCLLHEGFIFHVEHILHQVMPVKAADPQTDHEQAKIACCQRHHIQGGDRLVRKRQIQQPPVHEEENCPHCHDHPDTLPGNRFPFHADGAHAGNGQQKHGQELGPKDAAEYAGCPVKVHEYPVDDIQVQMPGSHARVAVHIDVDYQNENTDSPAEFHDFGQGSQIVFLLHSKVAFEGNRVPRVDNDCVRCRATCVSAVSFCVSCDGGTLLPRNRRPDWYP